MKGVILAAGKGTRLAPFTKVVNKNIAIIYDKPLIYYPIITLRDSGVTDILLIAKPGHGGQFLDLLGSGKDLGVKLTYDVQEEPLGIAHGLAVAQDFADEGKIAFILADNIFDDTFGDAVRKFSDSGTGAVIAVKEVNDPHRFGIAEMNGDAVVSLEEKPKHPKSNYAVTGFYLYDSSVFGIIKTINPSARGEYEITDVNRHYLEQGKLSAIKVSGFWKDAGTFDALLEASTHMALKRKK
ncbi:MAG: sugar phosphate nucleotidyltransferase [bacterium]|nr:sugar phosphate nucleotidyltransferase [bacterium]